MINQCRCHECNEIIQGDEIHTNYSLDGEVFVEFLEPHCEDCAEEEAREILGDSDDMNDLMWDSRSW